MPPSTDEQERDLDDISPHVRIRIDRRKKRDWIDYADENDLSLTDLIKESVDNTISGTWVLAEEVQNEDQSVSIDTSQLEDGIESILDRLNAFETQLDDVTLKDAPGNQEEYLTEGELLPLANRCHNRLPKAADGDQLIELTSQLLVPENSEIPQLSGTTRDIATALGESEHQVRQALIYLEREQNANISSIIHDGVRRWYEVDPLLDMEDVIEDVSDEYDVEFQTGTEFEQ